MKKPSYIAGNDSRKMKVNIKAVAQDCNVAISTVSRVINNNDYVSTKTREKVLHSIKKLGYNPNYIASNLRKSKTTYLGLVVPTITYDFFSNLAKSIQNYLNQKGYSLFILSSDDDFKKEEFHIRSLLNYQISGLIIVTSSVTQLAGLLPSGLPVVLVDRYNKDLMSRANTVVVRSDNFQGGIDAVDAFIQRKAQRIAFVMTNNKTNPQQLREEGFITAMMRHKIPAQNYRIISSGDKPEEVTRNILNLYHEFAFDALFCGNDRIAFGALYGLISNNIKVPEQLQVVGFDDIELVQYLRPSLSTIRQNIEMYGKIISSKITAMVEGEEINEQVVIPVEYINRETTK